jgi:hypothetical protein
MTYLVKGAGAMKSQKRSHFSDDSGYTLNNDRNSQKVKAMKLPKGIMNLRP